MYLVGVHLGYLIFFGNESSTKAGSIVARARIRVWMLCILFWSEISLFPSIHFLFPECMVILVIDTCRILSRSLTIILDKHVERVSRRMVSVVSDNEFD